MRGVVGDEVLTCYWDVRWAAVKPPANRERQSCLASPTTSRLGRSLAAAPPHSQQRRQQAQIFLVTPGQVVTKGFLTITYFLYFL